MKRNYFGFADAEISFQGNGLDISLCFKITYISDEQEDRPVGVLFCIAIRAGENRLRNAGSDAVLFTGWKILSAEGVTKNVYSAYVLSVFVSLLLRRVTCEV
jgi:hypothetical protein